MTPQPHRSGLLRPILLSLLPVSALALLSACAAPSDAPAVDNATSVPTSADGRNAGRSRAMEPADPIDSVIALETFDVVWGIVHDTHYDPQFGGVDWNSVRTELRPRAESIDDNAELRRLVMEMLARLGLSHYTIIPRELRADASTSLTPETPTLADDSTTSERATAREVADAGDETAPSVPRDDPSGSGIDDVAGIVGMTVRLVEGRVIVTAVRPDGPADRAGVRPGWVVDRIGERSVSAILGDLESSADADGDAPDSANDASHGDGWSEYVITSIIIDMLDRPAGRTVRLEMLDGDDARLELALTSVERPGETVELGPLRLSGEFASREVSGAEWHQALGLSDPASARRAGVIGFSVWIVPVTLPFHRAVDEFRDADGIVIDLRGNPGGIGGLVMGIGGHFLDEPKSLGSLRNRQGALEFRANPRRTDARGALVAPFAGPVAIIVDGLSGSTSEFFAGGMQAIGRARVFGSISAGAALPAALSSLPNGDALMYAIADFVLPDGTRLEGRGVLPDEPIVVTRADLLAGRDPALLAALRWIADQPERRAQASGAAPNTATTDPAGGVLVPRAAH